MHVCGHTEVTVALYLDVLSVCCARCCVMFAVCRGHGEGGWGFVKQGRQRFVGVLDPYQTE